ncbi:unnamed protein product [Paramecium sonneborni]|uniref:Uncharacterized protein n=1 Tax=Paramecium sonneborni TaxID=65129 RepID=A0A8S1M2D7_9CILI|nr:unnamed protein product [Paramecium sonneborni]
MQLFRAFLIYDFGISSFYLSVRRDFELDNIWKANLKEITQQIQIQNVIEEKEFQMKSNYGCIRGKFDILKNRVLILISTNQVHEIFQAELLLQLYSYLFELTQYQKVPVISIQQLNISDLELYQKSEVEKIIKKYEEKLTTSNIFVTSLSQRSSSEINEQKQQNLKTCTFQTEESIEKSSCYIQKSWNYNQKAFKGFLMYDKKKQFFLMLIRKGFNNDSVWVEERGRIEKLIGGLNKQKTSIMSTSTQFAQYLIEYDSQTNFYFILLSNNIIPDSPQYELLQRIKRFISNQSNLQKHCKFEIENSCLCAVSDIIDAQERIYIKKFHTQIIETNLFKKSTSTQQSTNVQSMNSITNNQENKQKLELLP